MAAPAAASLLATLDPADLQELRRVIDTAGDGDQRHNGTAAQTAAGASAMVSDPDTIDLLSAANLRLRRLGFAVLENENAPHVLLEILPEYERRGTVISRLVQKVQQQSRQYATTDVLHSKQLGDLHNKYNVLERLWREQTQHQRTADSEELVHSQTRLAEARAQTERCRTTLAASEATQARLSAQLEETTQQFNADLQRITQQLSEEQGRAEMATREIASLRSNVDRLTNELQNESARTAAAHAGTQALQQQLDAAQTELASTQMELARVQASKATSEERRQELRLQVDQLRTDMAQLQQRTSSTQTAEIERLRREILQMREQLAARPTAAAPGAPSQPFAPTTIASGAQTKPNQRADDGATTTSFSTTSQDRAQYRAIVKMLRQILKVTSSSHVIAAVEELIAQSATLGQLQNVINAMALMLALPPLSAEDRDLASTLVRISSAVVRLKEERDNAVSAPSVSKSARTASATSGSLRGTAVSNMQGHSAPQASSANRQLLTNLNLDTPFRELVQHFRRLFEVHSSSPELIIAAMNEIYIDRTQLQAAVNVARRVLNLDPSSSILLVIERLERLMHSS